jgi:hypothetical protein
MPVPTVQSHPTLQALPDQWAGSRSRLIATVAPSSATIWNDLRNPSATLDGSEDHGLSVPVVGLSIPAD